MALPSSSAYLRDIAIRSATIFRRLSALVHRVQLFVARVKSFLGRFVRAFGPDGFGGHTTIVIDGDFDSSELSRSLMAAFREAHSWRVSLPRWVLKMHGMSGRRYRRLVNGLVSRTAAPVYLEVGSWAGSTVCSAIANNKCRAICIDDWSQFGGPRDKFLRNVDRARGISSEVLVIEGDFRLVNFEELESPANLYLFDGPHSEEDQYDGIVMAQPALQHSYVLIVDDFNWPQVRRGTARAISDLGLEVQASITIRTNSTGAEPTRTFEASDWHNGYFIAVVRKGTAAALTQ